MQGRVQTPTKCGRNPAMKIWRIAAGISCCLILAAGCRMCQHPYYDCGPVWSQGACQNCNPDYRAGSVLNRHDRVAGRGRCSGAAEPRLVSRPVRRGAATHRSDGLDALIARRPVAQKRPTPKPAAADREPAQAPPKPTLLPEAPLPSDLPPRARAPSPLLRGPRKAPRASCRLPIGAWMNSEGCEAPGGPAKAAATDGGEVQPGFRRLAARDAPSGSDGSRNASREDRPLRGQPLAHRAVPTAAARSIRRRPGHGAGRVREVAADQRRDGLAHVVGLGPSGPAAPGLRPSSLSYFATTPLVMSVRITPGRTS